MEITKHSSIFTFCLYRKCEKHTFDYLNNVCNIGQYILRTDDKTPLDCAEKDGRKLVIFGYAADVFSGQSENLAETVLDSSENFGGVVEYERKLGGKYVIFYEEGDECFCMGDATCSIPVFYSTGLQSLICCSNPRMIIEEFGLKPDRNLQKIRNSGKLGQAMPYDTTPYKEVKRLLPNHYINLLTGDVNRFINCYKKQKRISYTEAAKITGPMIENITKMYLKNFKIYCPLTGGRDSRVIYAYLKKLNKGEVHSYTVWLDHLKSDRQDWDIPIEVAEKGGTRHEQIQLEKASQEEWQAINELLGKDGFPPEAFELSLTIKKHYDDGAVIEGDVLGQIAQCHVHRNTPNFLASPRYFRCKVHNYSKESLSLIKEWMDEVKKSGEKVNIMDMFSVENRLGVWAAYTHLVRNAIGSVNLNNLNSRSIIYLWTAIDTKERMNALLNFELIRLAYSETLEIPFGQDSRAVRFAKTNGLTFYLATFLKYYIEKRKFYSEQ